jgi:NADPH-dependent 2,4-dienoyl-CoA reductase/sulfur reductase-like enzyme
MNLPPYSSRHVVILGNGIAGSTAARHLRTLTPDRITMISAESDHFFSRTALMYLYMGHLERHHLKPYEDGFWPKNRIELLRATVTDLDTEAKTLKFSDDRSLTYDVLILATGSVSNKFGWPGQDLRGVQGLYSIQDVEAMETHTAGIERAVIVGGGLIGVELAEMLSTRRIPVTFLVRERTFWGSTLPHEEGELIGRHIREHSIDLRFSEELDRILDDGTGRARAVVTKKGEEIPAQFVGLAVGVSPNLSAVRNSPVETKRGILVNEYLETNIPDVYAIGDCTEFRDPPPGQKPFNQIWYTGRIMGETVARTIAGQRTPYRPGPFFNSAKFFDIEYQTYGSVPAKVPEGVETFYWEHANGKIALRLNYRTNDRALTGVNTLGIRLRHETFERWLKDRRPIEYVLEHLPQANFDPEFFKQHESDILTEFNRQTGSTLRLKAKKGILKRWFA